MSARRREEGVVLVLVLIFMMLLISSVYTFQRRAVLDATIAENRDASARAEALARGGVRLAVALLLEDRLREAASGLRAESALDVWWRAREIELSPDPDASLRLRISDASARLDLNALFEEGQAQPAAEPLLVAFFQKAIADAKLPEPDRYDPAELARNLIDWIDADDARLRGGLEDDVYQRKLPRYRAANRALLSLDELALVDGFDAELVEALRPSVTVFPWAKGGGINPNTAPPWVLALLFHGVAGDYRLASAQVVEDVVKLREAGLLLCDETADDPACTKLSESVPGEVFPPASFTAEVFEVEATARVGDVRRTIEAAIDRSDPSAPLILSWRVR